MRQEGTVTNQRWLVDKKITNKETLASGVNLILDHYIGKTTEDKGRAEIEKFMDKEII